MKSLVDFGSHWIFDTLIVLEEGLSRTEGEEHVKADGDMILVVGDEEADEFVVLIILTFNE